ncbi:MAG: hypothetical protein GKR94_09095 [Gammaproteobacteria bacterium]|nr:hypothetical protein [Gammaproteobacteria bacterium]
MCSRQSRGRRRDATRGQIEIANGFSTICHFIAGKDEVCAAQENAAETGDEEIELSAPLPADTMEMTIRPTYRTANWDIINRSNGGSRR